MKSTMWDRRLPYIVGYLYFQLIFNLMMVLTLVILVEQPQINLDPDIGSPSIWFISLSFSVTHIVMNYYLGMRWKRSALEDPRPKDWILSYGFYIIPVSLTCSFLLALLQLALPQYDDLTAPVGEIIFLSLLILVISLIIIIVFLPSLDLFLAFLGFARLMELILFPNGLPHEMAGFSSIVVLICCFLILPLVPVGTFYSQQIIERLR